MSNIVLRDYQKDAIADIYSAIRAGHRRILLQLCTGGGKTTIFSQVVKDFVSRRPTTDRVLVVAHRVELIDQMHHRLLGMGVANWCQRKASDQNPDQQVHSLSVQTFASKRYQRPDNVKLIVIDEAHHLQGSNTYGKLLGHYPDAFVLGVTATPIRLDKRGFRDVFDALIQGPPMADLIEQGFLSEYKIFEGITPDLSNVATKGGDYRARQLEEVCDQAFLIGDLVQNYQRLCSGQSAIVFGASVDHSQHIADSYNAAGIPAAHIDATACPEYRQGAINQFKSGEIKILSNYGLITEGFDVPACEVIQIARPTQSLGLYLQMVGRGLRPAVGKSHAIILDHAGVVETHGFPDEDREWTLDGCKKIKREEELSPREEIVRADKAPSELMLLEGDLVETSRQAKAVNEQHLMKLLAIQQARGYKPYWVVARLVETLGDRLTLDLLKLAAKQLGYKRGWAQHQWTKIQEKNLANSTPTDSIANYC
jgi:DNA repair protein RadD